MPMATEGNCPFDLAVQSCRVIFARQRHNVPRYSITTWSDDAVHVVPGDALAFIYSDGIMLY